MSYGSHLLECCASELTKEYGKNYSERNLHYFRNFINISQRKSGQKEHESVTERYSDEAARRARHRRRIEQMRESKRRQMRRRRLIKRLTPLVLCLLAVILLIAGGTKAIRHVVTARHKVQENVESLTGGEPAAAEQGNSVEVTAGGIGTGSAESSILSGETDTEENEPQKSYQASEVPDTVQLGDELSSGETFYSQYAILVDTENDNIIAERNAHTRIAPASMTKVLTVLTAAEHIDEAELDNPFTMTLELTDYAYVNDCSSAGFLDGEVITVRDLFYGTALPSGADAAAGLAVYVAGSQEAFVELMNEKVEALGLSKTTHFTNCAGIYDENHYTTAYDMAMIMEAAMDNEICREVMSAHRYTTSVTEEHPEGINLSNLFLRRIEDKEGGEKVLCAKTGYVAQSGNCAVSYAVSDSGKGYVCVTADANSKWRPVEDHAKLYGMYMQ